MPANLPPQYKDAEDRYRQAKTTPEKILALEEMPAIIPHHKGTDKLIAQLRKRLSQHKEESQRRSTAARKIDPFAIKKEGPLKWPWSAYRTPASPRSSPP